MRKAARSAVNAPRPRSGISRFRLRTSRVPTGSDPSLELLGRRPLFAGVFFVDEGVETALGPGKSDYR